MRLARVATPRGCQMGCQIGYKDRVGKPRANRMCFVTHNDNVRLRERRVPNPTALSSRCARGLTCASKNASKWFSTAIQCWMSPCKVANVCVSTKAEMGRRESRGGGCLVSRERRKRVRRR